MFDVQCFFGYVTTNRLIYVMTDQLAASKDMISMYNYVSDINFVDLSLRTTTKNAACVQEPAVLLESTARLTPTTARSVSVCAQDGTLALGKASMRSAPSLSSLSKLGLETVPM